MRSFLCCSKVSSLDSLDMMMSGTSLRFGSFLTRLHTENPFIRGSSIDSRMIWALRERVLQAEVAILDHGHLAAKHPELASQLITAADQLSNTRTLGAIGRHQATRGGG